MDLVPDQVEFKGECNVSKNAITLGQPASFISPASNKHLDRNDLDFGVSDMA